MGSQIGVSRAREVFSYDPETGRLIFRARDPDAGYNHGWNKRCAGKPAGKIDTRGYYQVRVDGVQVLAHRIVWLLHHGAMPDGWLDHINGDSRDNRIENLRPASPSENAHNKKIRSDSLTGIKGVSFVKRTGLWTARIQKEGRRFSLGYFTSADQAAAAYRTAAMSLHGDFARVA
jgi:hypothetical protein